MLGELKPKGQFAPDVIRKEAWPFYRTSSGVRLCWELEEPKGPKGSILYAECSVQSLGCQLVTARERESSMLTTYWFEESTESSK